MQTTILHDTMLSMCLARCARLTARITTPANMKRMPEIRQQRWSRIESRILVKGSGPLCRASPASVSSGTDAAEIEAGKVPLAGQPDTSVWTGAAIREAFLAFYESKGHTRLPSASLVPDDPTVMLTIAGMLQFKPIFLGKEAPRHKRATTTQKCVRTNDIENVGVTARHHTFFEMLGNFSFGDYFKEDAIKLAWELSTRVYGLQPERIWVSVFHDDDESFALWRDVVGVPTNHIQKLGAADNFWEAGATGPCGPCTELYYDLQPDRECTAASVEDDSRFIEFYNLVFMESNKAADGTLTPLAARNIDTGLGLERMAQILQGVSNNYDTDLLLPIVLEASRIANIDYHSSDFKTRTALRVIGDHTRAVVYLLSDGVLPSNIGRGYIVRRLLRRVIVKGALLGIENVFTPQIAAVVISLSQGCDPRVNDNADRILEEMRCEEERFRKTLAAGKKFLAGVLQEQRAKMGAAQHGQPMQVPGDRAFLLYDSYGFPLEITAEIAAEEGASVDTAAFDAAMSAQRQRSKDSVKVVDMTAGSALGDLATRVANTIFVGHSSLKTTSRVVALLKNEEQVNSVTAGDDAEVILDKTPFYAQGGGQAGDIGYLAIDSAPEQSGSKSEGTVCDTQKGAGGSLYVHTVHWTAGSLSVGDHVTATVDNAARRCTAAHHTATHLLQSALRLIAGETVSQQGSAVGPDRLRFDFSLSRGLSGKEVRQVEDLVNGWIGEGFPVETREMSLDDARAAGALAMFDEKYSDVVRVLSVADVSMELCGGTHVTATDQIGAFKVISEAGVASGVRRIEAVVGQAAVKYLNEVDDVARGLASKFKVPLQEVPARVQALQAELKATHAKAEELQRAVAMARIDALTSSAIQLPGGASYIAASIDGLDTKSLQEAASQLQQQLGDPAAVFLVTSPADGKVAMAVAASPAAISAGVNAGKLVGQLAKHCSGGGGGRPNLAQAGGKDTEGIPAALSAANTALAEALSG